MEGMKYKESANCTTTMLHDSFDERISPVSRSCRLKLNFLGSRTCLMLFLPMLLVLTISQTVRFYTLVLVPQRQKHEVKVTDTVFTTAFAYFDIPNESRRRETTVTSPQRKNGGYIDGDRTSIERENATSSTTQESIYAYAFVIGGCDPESKSKSYRNYLYNILVATKILRDQGSKADVVAMFQLSSKSSFTELPASDVKLLHSMDIELLYIPKSPNQSFYRTNVDKFRILGLTQYRRVLFMDGDVVPVGNLDYLFQMSDGNKAIISQNLVLQGNYEPANGGVFMLEPSIDDLNRVNYIIQQREEYAKQAPYPFFDVVHGWGHKIQSPDEWVALKDRGTNWTFLAAFADQGLLYHWVKYEKASYTIITKKGIVENWGSQEKNGTKTIVLKERLVNPFKNSSSPIACFGRFNCKQPVWSDFIHFSGIKKPWLRGVPDDPVTNLTMRRSPQQFWWYTLHQLNTELSIGLNFSKWRAGRKQRGSLGMYPVYKEAKTSDTNLLEPLRRG